MRKYLGVLAGVVGLCVMSWAQTPAPAQTPDQVPSQGQPEPQAPTPEATPIPTSVQAKPAAPTIAYPRIEFFAGGSYAEAGLFNAGHWAGLPGWDASLGLNVTHWIGVLVDGGQYFGTSKIPTATPQPFPNCPNFFCPGTTPTFDVATREYNILFGLQFARRKYEHWTPIGQLLFGHQGTRGVATGEGSSVAEVGPGRALVAGGGLDYKINERFALRLKADYLQTSSQFPTYAKNKQDNFRVSVGVVIRSVRKKKRRLEDETQTEQ